MAESVWQLAQSSLAQWLSGIATIFAVIVALSREWWVKWFHKPELTATCKKESPWTTKVPFFIDGGKTWAGESYYIRAQVENTGNVRAEKVQVYAAKLAKLGPGGKYAEIQTFLPLNMRWANFPPGPQGAFLDSISPDMAAFCDIVALCDPAANKFWPLPANPPIPTTLAVLQLEADVRDRVLEPGTYRLTLRIAAANAKPIERTFEFSHSGTWDPDDALMRQNHLTVSLK